MTPRTWAERASFPRAEEENDEDGGADDGGSDHHRVEGRDHQSVGRPKRTLLGNEKDREQPEDEAADVREDGYAAGLIWVGQADAALPDLQRDPDAEEPDRRDLTQEDEAEEDRGQHPCPREQQEIRPEHACDR